MGGTSGGSGSILSLIATREGLAMRLLLVEDEAEIQRFLQRALSEAGFEVDTAGDAKTAMKCVADAVYSILVVDLGLPDQDGIELILALRRVGVTAPVLILSARRSVDERVKGLEEGGDDYLTKPFALVELIARIRNLLKRDGSAEHKQTSLRVHDLELDLLQREVTLAGRPIRLTSQEFALLEFLCRHAGRIVTRSMILEKVWGIRFEPKTNNLDVHMSRLRSKIDGNARKPLIETLRGKGYVLRSA
jgi:two-component system copper resistance phosphate regulon response regulator CusR